MKTALLHRIAAFEEVQAIEYRFDFVNRALDASCFSKAKKLSGMFAAFGLAARPICCRCRWDQSGLPKELIQKALSPETQHFFVQVYIPETQRWANVDPTFDVGLRSAGFYAPEWDGLSSTRLAMAPIATFDAEQSAAICKMKDSVGAEDYQAFLEVCGGFYDQLNNWIASQRRTSSACRERKPEGWHYA